MASEAKIIGRIACSFCGFEHAHCKQAPGKRAYVHCPDCGLLTQARSGHQEGLLLKGMRDPAATPPAEQAAPVHAVAAAASSTPPARPRGLWDQLMSTPA